MLTSGYLIFSGERFLTVNKGDLSPRMANQGAQAPGAVILRVADHSYRIRKRHAVRDL